MPAKIEFSADALKEVDNILKRIEVMQHHRIFKKAVRDAGNVMKKRYKELVPTPGSPADNGVAPLSKAISLKVKDTKNGVMAIVGEKQDKTGYHAHLVEKGHKIISHGKDTGKMTTGEPYGERAKEQTQDQMNSTLVDSVKQAVEETVRN